MRPLPVGWNVSFDVVLEAVIFGITGALIGLYLDHWGVCWGGTILGCVLGGFLGWLTGGTEVIPVTTGTGSAIGGFVGINIEHATAQAQSSPF